MYNRLAARQTTTRTKGRLKHSINSTENESDAREQRHTDRLPVESYCCWCCYSSGSLHHSLKSLRRDGPKLHYVQLYMVSGSMMMTSTKGRGRRRKKHVGSHDTTRRTRPKSRRRSMIARLPCASFEIQSSVGWYFLFPRDRDRDRRCALNSGPLLPSKKKLWRRRRTRAC